MELSIRFGPPVGFTGLHELEEGQPLSMSNLFNKYYFTYMSYAVIITGTFNMLHSLMVYFKNKLPFYGTIMFQNKLLFYGTIMFQNKLPFYGTIQYYRTLSLFQN